MLRRAPLLLLILACTAILIGWNGSRFIGAKPKVRAKDLAFLPSPAVARAMCLGHTNTVAKLRWIDSFAYFQYQCDHLDDHVPGQDTRGGFYRLYDTLITLDPYFQPFYEHAALNLSGILGRHQHALGFLMRGLDHLPHNTALWRNTAATLKVHFHWEDQQPQAFDGFLASWAAAELDDNGRRMVWDWKRAMGQRQFKGLEQLSYWLDQLQTTKAKTPMGDYVEETARAQLAAYGERELTALAQLHRRTTPPALDAWYADLADPALPLADQLRLGRMPTTALALAHPRLASQRYGDRLPGFGPLRVAATGRLELRPDPYGHPWRINGVKVESVGLVQRNFEKRLGYSQVQLIEKAKEKGRWPTTIDEVRAWGVAINELPNGGTLRIVDQQLAVTWEPPLSEPWKLR